MVKKWQYLLMALLAVSISAGAFAQSTPEPKCDQCEVLGWGPNVHLTSALMSGQTFRRIFCGNFPVSEAVDMWLSNMQFVPDCVPQKQKDTAETALKSLQTMFKDPANAAMLGWTMKDLYTMPWNELPPVDNAAAKAKVLEQFIVLKQEAHMLSLTFVNRALATPASPLATDNFSKIRNCARTAAFQHMSFGSLFSVPMDPESFDDAEVDILVEALKAGILWDEKDLPDVKVKNTRGEIEIRANNMCCDKRVGSPTYRKCIALTGANCTMCGSYCCGLSTNCP